MTITEMQRLANELTSLERRYGAVVRGVASSHYDRNVAFSSLGNEDAQRALELLRDDLADKIGKVKAVIAQAIGSDSEGV